MCISRTSKFNRPQLNCPPAIDRTLSVPAQRSNCLSSAYRPFLIACHV